MPVYNVHQINHNANIPIKISQLGSGGTTVAVLEKFLADVLLNLLHPHHTICMLTKRNIISLYSQRSLKSVTREDFIRIKELCEESIEVNIDKIKQAD